MVLITFHLVIVLRIILNLQREIIDIIISTFLRVFHPESSILDLALHLFD